jgi:hypothetical protein
VAPSSEFAPLAHPPSSMQQIVKLITTATPRLLRRVGISIAPPG